MINSNKSKEYQYSKKENYTLDYIIKKIEIIVINVANLYNIKNDLEKENKENKEMNNFLIKNLKLNLFDWLLEIISFNIIFKKHTIDKNILEIMSKKEIQDEKYEYANSINNQNFQSYKIISPFINYSDHIFNNIMNNSKEFMIYFSTIYIDEEYTSCTKSGIERFLRKINSKNKDQFFIDSNIKNGVKEPNAKLNDLFNIKSCFKSIKSNSKIFSNSQNTEESFSEQILNDIFIKSTNFPKNILNIKAIIK